MNIPITEQDIINVRDEYALVMEIWHEIERLANSFVRSCTDIQDGYKNRLKEIEEEIEASKLAMDKEFEKHLAELENQKASRLDELKNEFKRVQKEYEDKKERAQNKRKKIIDDSVQYKMDISSTIARNRKKITENMDMILNAEKAIKSKKYQEIAMSAAERVKVEADTLEQLVYRNPMQLAVEIKELEEQRFGKLRNSNEIREKCIEFYSIRCKAQELYEQEIDKEDDIMPDVDSRIYHMLGAAEEEMKEEVERIDAALAGLKEKYVKESVEAETEYDSQISKLKEKHEAEKQKQDSQFDDDKKQADIDRQKLLLEALKAYQEEQLHNLPPHIIKRYVDSLMKRKLHNAQEFQISDVEPYNITVGYIYFMFRQFLTNKVVERFMVQNYGFILKNGCFIFPYTIAINESLALCYRYDNRGADTAMKNMQNICMNIFLSTPPNKMRFHFIDPLKSGQSFAMFKHFEEENSSNYKVIPGGIQTEESAIEQQLQIVVDHIKSMQVNTFKGQYSNIREYNAENTLMPQPYNVIGIMDFPAGFTNKSLELLSQVVATGKACGVYLVIMSSIEQKWNMDQKTRGMIENIEKMCSTFEYVNPGYVKIDNYAEESDLSDKKNTNMIRYMIDSPLEIKEVIAIAPVMKKGIREAGRIVIGYDNIAPGQDMLLKYSTDAGISIPIGLSGGSNVQRLNLGMEGSQAIHALICGQIGSGKSRLLHAIITGALLQYPKEELAIYLVDFKSGTEFKIYADYNLPNFKVVAIESEQEFGLSVLKAIKREGERRAQIFNTCTKSDITSYNNSPDALKYGRMPRVLIVIDEFHVLFSDSNPDIAREAAQIMDEILRLDRSYGFHVVLCSQSIRGMDAINEAALAQIAVRIALKCPREDAEIVLGKGADAIAQIEENDAGSAIYLPAISSPRTNNRFRVGYLSHDRHQQILEQLDRHYTEAGIHTEARILVSDVSDSRNSVFQRYYTSGEITSKNRVLHFGEPLRVESDLEIRFEQAFGNNMLLVGKNSQKAQNMLFFLTLDLILFKVSQLRQKEASINIHVLNYCDGANTDFNDKLQDLGMSVPQLIHYYDGDSAVAGIEQTYNRLAAKKPGEQDDWLIISNLALASYLQKRGGLTGDNQAENSVADKFERLLKEGPARGVFCVVWCDDAAIYKLKYGHTFEYFKKRVVFNMSDEDALELADIVKDDSINKNNAYIYQSGKGKEKFRPYDAPMDSWVRRLCDECLSDERI